MAVVAMRGLVEVLKIDLETFWAWLCLINAVQKINILSWFRNNIFGPESLNLYDHCMIIVA